MKHNFFIKTVWAVVMAVVFLFPASWKSFALAQTDNELAVLVQNLKKDPKGPFQAIKWYCPDGQVLSAKEKCASPGGRQHGSLKDWVNTLEKEKKIYLNTVLSGSPNEVIWDNPDYQSRLKQYALLQFLFQIDDGWVYRLGQYYRGAVQAEDENEWGGQFLAWILADPQKIATRFFLAREACQVIPHFNQNKNRLQTIRSVSKELSDITPGFMNLRIKIHGQPDSKDLQAVRDFVQANRTFFDANQSNLFRQLIDTLEAEYHVAPLTALDTLLLRKSLKIGTLSGAVAALNRSRGRLDESVNNFSSEQANPYEDMAQLLFMIRHLVSSAPPDIRVALMDTSLDLEKILFSTLHNWQPRILSELLDKTRVLVKAAAGCGYIEIWEWEAFENDRFESTGDTADFTQFQIRAEQTRRIVDWGTAMVQSIYQPEILRFSPFEPAVNGFVDDRIRSSILLPLGETVGRLTDIVQKESGITHQLPPDMKTNTVRGMNPGLSYGILEVIVDNDTPLEIDPKKIYAFKTIPSELKPVAGLLTVSEGNMVSHVQLLARNLGIPNAVISAENLESLKLYSGQRIFYAVSQKGAVILKTDEQLSPEETDLVRKKERQQELFRVPVEKIDLEQKTLIPLSRVRAKDSGEICGPKAANLGQLKHLFPDNVGEGIVIPFGIFRQHMDQPMPGNNMTFWQFLTQTLSAPADNEKARIATLAKLQSAIRSMPFLPGFEADLNQQFQSAFGAAVGSLAVFIRSDTNMEDIREFTGAGLNLTVFNVRDKHKLLQGIRDVWASPYSERSYLWRQKYLENPENVFPSILLLPSVNVDRSGVVITHGIVSGEAEDVTVAFSRGVGGAVDGQMAETYLLTGSKHQLLLQPSREIHFIKLPAEGGVERETTGFNTPILTRGDRIKIRLLVETVRRILPGTPGIEGSGPFDIELGFFNDTVHLFQVRPFVENKKAGTLNYLLEQDKKYSGPKTLLMNRKL